MQINSHIDQQRSASYDWLRVISIMLVVFLHINGLSVQSFCTNNLNTAFYSIIIFFFALPIPLFFMMSGGLMIRQDYCCLREFYNKKLSRLLIPWGILGFFIAAIRHVAHTAYWQKNDILDTVHIYRFLSFLQHGGPSIIWFLLALIGLYFVTPLLIYIRKKTSLFTFFLLTLTVIFLTYFILIPLSGYDYYTHPVNYFKGVYFLGHYMLGYCIREFALKNSIINTRTIIFIFFLLSFFYITVLFIHFSGKLTTASGLPFSTRFLTPDPVSAQLPANLILSSIIFFVFTRINLPYKRSVNYISSLGLIIYLFHPIPLIFLRFLYRKFSIYDSLYQNSLVFAIFGYIVGYLLSLFVAHVCMTIYRLIKNSTQQYRP